MPYRLLLALLPLLPLLALAGCATTEGVPGCPPPAPGPVYLDILEFQQGLNEATRQLDGEWAAGLGPIFQRLDSAIAAQTQRVAQQPEGCREHVNGDLLRLRAVRARGEQFIAQVRQYLAANDAALKKLRKQVPTEARLGDLRLRLLRIDEGGQRFIFRAANLSRKQTHRLATHRLIETAQAPELARPAYFLLSDDLANAYRLVEVSPATTAQHPLTLAPGAQREIVVRFAGPFAAPASKLTLQVDASLVPSDARHARRSPATLVLPRSLLPAGEPPVFIAEPGRG